MVNLFILIIIFILRSVEFNIERIYMMKMNIEENQKVMANHSY